MRFLLYKTRSLLRKRNLQNLDWLRSVEKGGVGIGEGTAGRIAVCSLRSVSLTFLRPASIYCIVLSISCVRSKHTSEGVVREGMVRKDVLIVLKEIGMPSSSSASEGGCSNDFEEYEEEEEAAETVESEEGEEEEDEEKLSGYRKWVRKVARVVERVGLVGRRNWDAKRKRRFQKGVGG